MILVSERGEGTPVVLLADAIGDSAVERLVWSVMAERTRALIFQTEPRESQKDFAIAAQELIRNLGSLNVRGSSLFCFRGTAPVALCLADSNQKVFRSLAFVDPEVSTRSSARADFRSSMHRIELPCYIMRTGSGRDISAARELFERLPTAWLFDGISDPVEISERLFELLAVPSRASQKRKQPDEATANG